MTRQQRRSHLWLWLVLTPLLAGALTLVLAARPALKEPPSTQDALKEVMP
jgi:hypothetical protein